MGRKNREQTMEINEEEAWTVFVAMDTNLHERELTLRKRIKKEFPAIDEKIKRLKRRKYLWETEVEEDERVKKIRAKMEGHKEECHNLPWGSHEYNAKLGERYALIDVLLKQKANVLNELMKKEGK